MCVCFNRLVVQYSTAAERATFFWVPSLGPVCPTSPGVACSLNASVGHNISLIFLLLYILFAFFKCVKTNYVIICSDEGSSATFSDFKQFCTFFFNTLPQCKIFFSLLFSPQLITVISQSSPLRQMQVPQSCHLWVIRSSTLVRLDSTWLEGLNTAPAGLMAVGQGNLHCVHVCTKCFTNTCLSLQTKIYLIKMRFYMKNVFFNIKKCSYHMCVFVQPICLTHRFNDLPYSTTLCFFFSTNVDKWPLAPVSSLQLA